MQPKLPELAFVVSNMALTQHLGFYATHMGLLQILCLAGTSFADQRIEKTVNIRAS
jgi:hypothetical protein